MNLIGEIKDKVKMNDLLREFAIFPERNRNIYKCFFHNDHKPSASITKTDKFHCFSCQQTADIFDVVCYLCNCDFKTALKVIDKKFNLGLTGNLTPKEKREIVIEAKKREELKKRKEFYQKYQNEKTIEIANALHFWERVVRYCEPKFTEIINDEWKFENLYFYGLKEIERLEYLYDLMCEKEPEECNFTHTYGTSKVKVLRKIYTGDIKI